MAGGTIGILAAALAMLALAGCEQSTAPPGTPGSVNVYLHGRAETDLGAFSR